MSRWFVQISIISFIGSTIQQSEQLILKLRFLVSTFKFYATNDISEPAIITKRVFLDSHRTIVVTKKGLDGLKGNVF